ncbi:hypothetical protein [Sphaerisporangium perillae]|uniref:hypothetical protein n=1 Tax=Sphaerisporangium perillae TaxID=2935860 RepID=UPI00200F2A62|nr:hypothetical protein [Sphaerisporangium perillae]
MRPSSVPLPGCASRGGSTGTALDGAGITTAGSAVQLWTPNSSTNNQYTITAV